MSVLAALVAGALGLLVGWTLERFRQSGTDRRWLLDHRHEALLTYLIEADALFRAAFSVSQSQPGAVAELNARMASITHAYFDVALTCSRDAKQWVDELYTSMREVSDETDYGRLESASRAHATRVFSLLKLARNELQPATEGWRRRTWKRLVPQGPQ